MVPRLAPWISIAALSGCSLILDTGDLPSASDAPVDASLPDSQLPPDGMLADANPDDLMIGTIEPAVLDEGAGTDGGRPVSVLVFAPNVIDSAQISVAWTDTTAPDAATGEPDQVTIDDVRVSGVRQALALALRVPVLPALHEGETRALTVTVTQASVSRMFTLTVLGHDELVLASDIDTDSFDYESRVYSSITVEGTVHAKGARPLILTSTGTFVVNGTLDAGGVGAGAGGNPGPGGCGGGGGGISGSTAGLPGGCGDGGGHGGAQGEKPGGGGGFGTGGTSPTNGGAGGAAEGVPMLVPIHVTTDLPEHRGNGGGGGGFNTTQNGGAGGNGGGVVVLTAGGTFRVGAAGRVKADGAPGAAGDELLTVHGGDGGSGSGGAILIRSTRPIVGSGAWLSATGGAATQSGGGGGDGRIRIDSPSGTVASAPAATLGPAWADSAPVLVQGANRITPTIRALGGCYGFFPGEPLTPAGTDPCTSGAATFDRTVPGAVSYDLRYGHNLLCASWTTTAGAAMTRTLPEAKSCIDVVYLPD